MLYRYQNSTGQTSFLHGKEVTLQNGRRQQFFSFAREARPGEALDAIPAGKEVIENPRTGLPFLKGVATVSPAETPPATRGARIAAGAQRAATRR